MSIVRVISPPQKNSAEDIKIILREITPGQIIYTQSNGQFHPAQLIAGFFPALQVDLFFQNIDLISARQILKAQKNGDIKSVRLALDSTYLIKKKNPYKASLM